MSNRDDSGSNIWGIIFGIYMLISQIMTVIFWIRYCKADDSILELIFIDPIISEIKGLLWIFFI